MADRNCAGFGEKIGYERRFYRDDADDLIHATCAEDDEPPPDVGPHAGAVITEWP